MNIICKLKGHNWIFPNHKLTLGSSAISMSDYKCSRCGITKDKDRKSMLSAIKVQREINKYHGVDSSYLDEQEEELK